MSRLRPIKRGSWEKYLREIGCEKIRQKSSHIIYHKPGLKRPIVFQADKEVAPHIIKTNLRTLNITLQDFLREIEKVK